MADAIELEPDRPPALPPGPEGDPRAPGAAALAYARLALIVPLFGLAWCVAAALALLVRGAIAGWCDMRDVTEGD